MGLHQHKVLIHTLRGTPQVSVKAVIHEETRVKTQCRLTLSAWVRLTESNARRFIVCIFKTQDNLRKGFEATMLPIPGAH